MSPVIEFRELSKLYSIGFWGKKQWALSRLSLSVPEGSIYGFLGANGAGKTTSIKILLGLQFATSGEVFIRGRRPSEKEARADLGFLPERPYLHDTMTADSFLDFHRALHGKIRKGKNALSNGELLEMVGLSHVQGKLLKDFSKGMLQRIAIAQALVNDPSLIVLDEPMSGLDPVGRKEVRDLILQLSARGKTIFFSSHILSDVEAICHRLAFLEKGVLKFEGSLDQLRESESSSYELIFTGMNEEALGRSLHLKGSVASGKVRLLRCTQEDTAKAALQEVLAAGGGVISYHKEQKSLEELLFGKGRERESGNV